MGQDTLLHGKTFVCLSLYCLIPHNPSDLQSSIRSYFSGYALLVGSSKLLLIVHFSEFLMVSNWKEDTHCHLDIAYLSRGRMKKSLMSISTTVNLFSALL